MPRGGRLVAERLEWHTSVIVVDEPPEDRLRLYRRIVLRVPGSLALGRPEPSLHQHIVPPPGPTVHALRHVGALKQRDVLL